MFNIFLCFSVFRIHTELISSQYMPKAPTIQPPEKGLRLRRKAHVHQLFPPGAPALPGECRAYRHRKILSASVFTVAVWSHGKDFSPLLILPYHSSHARSISGAGPVENSGKNTVLPEFHEFSGNQGHKKPGFPVESRACEKEWFREGAWRAVLQKSRAGERRCGHWAGWECPCPGWRSNHTSRFFLRASPECTWSRSP